MSDSSSDDEQGVKRLKSLADVQRLKIEKLMRNPVCQIPLPLTHFKVHLNKPFKFLKERETFVIEKTETAKPPKAFNPHEFVRNVMGKYKYQSRICKNHFETLFSSTFYKEI